MEKVGKVRQSGWIDDVTCTIQNGVKNGKVEESIEELIKWRAEVFKVSFLGYNLQLN